MILRKKELFTMNASFEKPLLIKGREREHLQILSRHRICSQKFFVGRKEGQKKGDGAIFL